MQSIGDENRIQALFSELKHADERQAIPFGEVWNAAQSRTTRWPGRLNLSYAAVTLIVAGLVLVSLAVWRSIGNRPQPEGIYPKSDPSTLAHFDDRPEHKAKDSPQITSNHRGSHHEWVARRTELRKERALAVREAVSISRWRSPTAALLHLPGDELLKEPSLLTPDAELKSLLNN